jgi:hypothetical protein
MPTRKFTTEILNAAILGLESQKDKLDVQIAAIRQMLDGNRPEPAATSQAAPRKRSKFSAASRRKMALAQKARWAKLRGESAPTKAAAASVAAKPKRKLSKKGRMAIVAALEKRWAQKRVEAAKAAR